MKPHVYKKDGRWYVLTCAAVLSCKYYENAIEFANQFARKKQTFIAVKSDHFNWRAVH